MPPKDRVGNISNKQWTAGEKIQVLIQTTMRNTSSINWQLVQRPEGRTILAAKMMIEAQNAKFRLLSSAPAAGAAIRDDDETKTAPLKVTKKRRAAAKAQPESKDKDTSEQAEIKKNDHEAEAKADKPPSEKAKEANKPASPVIDLIDSDSEMESLFGPRIKKAVETNDNAVDSPDDATDSSEDDTIVVASPKKKQKLALSGAGAGSNADAPIRPGIENDTSAKGKSATPVKPQKASKKVTRATKKGIARPVCTKSIKSTRATK